MGITTLVEDVEAVSAHYADRHNIDRSDHWFLLKLNEEVGELTQAYLALRGQARDKRKSAEQLQEDFEHELADVLVQTLLIARRMNVDVEKAVEDKWSGIRTGNSASHPPPIPSPHDRRDGPRCHCCGVASPA
jgi:NTP pyrophosphatase (non-canonical NTP hydrolase)